MKSKVSTHRIHVIGIFPYLIYPQNINQNVRKYTGIVPWIRHGVLSI